MRYANHARTMIALEDGRFVPVDAGNADYASIVRSGAEIAPFQRWANLSAAKADLVSEVERVASTLRFAVSGTSDAAKLLLYREKYAAALGALAEDPAAVTALTPEATARGETVAQLAALVVSLGEAWTAAGLAIDAAYQSHKAAITALADIAACEAYDTSAAWPA